MGRTSVKSRGLQGDRFFNFFIGNRVELPRTEPRECRLGLFARYDELFCTMRPRLAKYDLSCEALGDLDTLLPRLQAEFDAAKSFGACGGLVGAWSRCHA
jgi:hypothetical protein